MVIPKPCLAFVRRLCIIGRYSMRAKVECQGMSFAVLPFWVLLTSVRLKPLTHFVSVVELREMLTVLAMRRTRRSKPTSQRRLGAFCLDDANTSVS